jgi:uncharacterized protein (TIGR02757 family)
MDPLKRKLEYHYKKFDASQIYPDPLIFPHRFTQEMDIELSAFISSVFAYGNVTQILNTLERVHTLMGDSPTEFIRKFNPKKNKIFFRDVKHRFYTGDDIRQLFLILQYVLKEYESLKHLFLLYHFDHEKSIKNSLSSFSNNLIDISRRLGGASDGVRFMFPNPNNGSACKRMNLFLRWVVRNDELDFGIWKAIRTDELVIPVDTHIAKISRELGLTKKKNVSWRMAEEITENLKKIDPKDPIKYDFAICHIGIRKLKF